MNVYLPIHGCMIEEGSSDAWTHVGVEVNSLGDSTNNCVIKFREQVRRLFCVIIKN